MCSKGASSRWAKARRPLARRLFTGRDLLVLPIFSYPFTFPCTTVFPRWEIFGRVSHGLVRRITSLGWLLPPPVQLIHRSGFLVVFTRTTPEDAYFHVRKLGYAIEARNFRWPRCRGAIDLLGWDADVLCFKGVKTRTSRDLKTPEAAVGRHKRRQVAQVAREYLRRLPPSCQWRFDIVGVYYANPGSRPQIEVFRNASLSA
jgi:Holliday junction resolvase-like predicted endonuclease